MERARERSRDDVLTVLRRAYGPDAVAKARPALPDPINLDRDAALLARFGLTAEQLYDAGGASP
jgi:hypothetical protein